MRLLNWEANTPEERRRAIADLLVVLPEDLNEAMGTVDSDYGSDEALLSALNNVEFITSVNGRAFTEVYYGSPPSSLDFINLTQRLVTRFPEYDLGSTTLIEAVGTNGALYAAVESALSDEELTWSQCEQLVTGKSLGLHSETFYLVALAMERELGLPLRESLIFAIDAVDCTGCASLGDAASWVKYLTEVSGNPGVHPAFVVAVHSS